MMILHCTSIRFNEKRLVSEIAIGTEQEISFGKENIDYMTKGWDSMLRLSGNFLSTWNHIFSYATE